MRVERTIRFAGGAAAVLGAALLAAPLTAQGPPGMQRGPSPVRYTEAKEYSVRQQIVLPGSVESRVTSVVAAEVSALVVAMKAREGDRVKKGDPLVQLRTKTLEIRKQALAAQLKEAEAQLKLAELNLERASELLEARVISRQDYDDRFYTYNARKGRVDALKAQIEGVELDLARSTVRAPFDGVIYQERTEVGEWIGEGDPVMEMVALNQLEIRVDVPERYYRHLNVGDPATITFESLPEVKVTGQITALIPRADPQARTFPIKLRIPNRGGKIGVGMLAQVALAAGRPEPAIVVPKDAVIRRGDRQFVYLLNGDNTVSLVPVNTGAGAGAWVAVQGSVRPGMKVVTRGNERLQPGQSVQGRPQEYELP